MSRNYDGPHLNPGDRYTVIGLDGEQHEDIVHSIRYRDARPEIRQHPRGWRRILRAVTPRRWRKPLPIVRPYRPGGVEVIGQGEYARRAARVAEDMHETISRLLDHP